MYHLFPLYSKKKKNYCTSTSVMSTFHPYLPFGHLVFARNCQVLFVETIKPASPSQLRNKSMTDALKSIYDFYRLQYFYINIFKVLGP